MIKQNDYQLFWEWPADDVTCWDGKRASLTTTTPRPWLACKVAAPVESYWRYRPPDTQPRPEHCQDGRPDSKFWNAHNTQKKLSYVSLPEALIPPECQSSLVLKATEPEKHFNGEKISRWRTRLQNSPHPEFCRNHCHSFWAPFSRFMEKPQLAEKQVAFSPQKFRKILGQYLKIL